MTNMSIAISILSIVGAVVLVCLVILFARVEDLRRKNLRLESHLTAIEERFHRRAQVASARTTFKSPGVDSRAVTTKRDTDDLPRTGRMVQGVKRVRSDDDREHHDSELR